MRKSLFFFIVLMLSGSVYAEKLKLAVMEFEDRSETLDKIMLANAAEYLRSEFVQSDQFMIIAKERQEKVIIQEMKKESYQMCKDKNCQIPLGQALSADTILRTTINYFGGIYTITVELIDLAKEAVIKGAKFKFDGTEQGLMKAMDRITVQIAKKAVSFKPEVLKSDAVPNVEIGGVELSTVPEIKIKQAEFKDVSSSNMNKFNTNDVISLDADPDVLVAYDAAVSADENGDKNPEMAMKKWQELSKMQGKNPFKEKAVIRYNEWAKHIKLKELGTLFEKAKEFDSFGKFFPDIAISKWEKLTISESENPYFVTATERIESWKDFKSQIEYYKIQKEKFQKQHNKDASNLVKLLPLKVLKPEQKRAMMIKFLEIYAPFYGVDDIELIFSQFDRQQSKELMEILYNDLLNKEMESKCQEGQGSACYIFASLTEVEKPDIALQFFEKACEKGVIDSCIKAGKMFYDRNVEEKAFNLFSDACSWESGEGCHYTAFFVETGYFKERIPSVARELYKKACDNGYSISCKMNANIINHGYSSDQVKNMLEKKEFNKKISDAVGTEGDDISKEVAKKVNIADTSVTVKVKEKYHPYKWAGISMIIVGAGILIGGTTGFAVTADNNYDKYRELTTDERIIQSIASGVPAKDYLDIVDKYKENGDLYRTLSIVSGVTGSAIMITGIVLAAIPKEREVLKKVSFITDGKGFYAGIGFEF